MPYIRELIECDDQNVCDQALWAMGCVIPQYPFLQKRFRKSGTVEALLQRINVTMALPFLKDSVNITGLLLLEEPDNFWLLRYNLQSNTVQKVFAALMLLMKLDDADLALLRNAVRIVDNIWPYDHELPKDTTVDK